MSCPRIVSPDSARSEATANKVINHRIKLSRVSGLVGLIATRNVNDRAKSSTSQEHAILVANELLFGGISLRSPVRAILPTIVEVAWKPATRTSGWNEVAAPADARPI